MAGNSDKFKKSGSSTPASVTGTSSIGPVSKDLKRKAKKEAKAARKANKKAKLQESVQDNGQAKVNKKDLVALKKDVDKWSTILSEKVMVLSGLSNELGVLGDCIKEVIECMLDVREAAEKHTSATMELSKYAAEET